MISLKKEVQLDMWTSTGNTLEKDSNEKNINVAYDQLLDVTFDHIWYNTRGTIRGEFINNLEKYVANN